MRGRKPKFTQKEVIEALKSSGGIISLAARKLGCSRTTIYNYIHRYAKVREAYEEITETWLDIAEMKLFQKILEGDLRAITFYLRNKGASRGYGPVGKKWMPPQPTIEIVLPEWARDEDVDVAQYQM